MAQSSQHRTASVFSHLARRPMRHRISHQAMFNCPPPRARGGVAQSVHLLSFARALLRTPAGPIPYEKPYKSRGPWITTNTVFQKCKMANTSSCTDGFGQRNTCCYLIGVFLWSFRSWSAPRAKLVWLKARGNDLRKPASHRKP